MVPTSELASANVTSVVVTCVTNTPAVGGLIRDSKTFQIPTVMQTSAAMGMMPMDGALHPAPEVARAAAPFVDLVFGPQTLHRLPELLARRRETGQPQVDISFPEIEKFDHLPPPRVEGASAFVSMPTMKAVFASV